MTQGGVLATSVFIAAESGRPLDAARLPVESAISVVTLAELEAGVLTAPNTEVRARRLGTLNAVMDVELLPVDAAAARMWAHLRVRLAEAGRRINVNDLWIAATAAAHGIPVVTQDDDFQAVEGLADLQVIKV